jgi:hypothetical protein
MSLTTTQKFMAHKNKIESEHGGQELTTQPLANSTDNSDWFRLPKPKQRLWGMSRTTWCELCESGAVRSIVLKKRHAQRGIRLVFRPSAEAYLKSLLDGKESQS